MTERGAPARRAGPWGETGDALARAVAGGMLFGIPLLYTMEVWWIGTQSEPPAILAALLVSAVPVYALNRTAGFRRTADVRTVDALADTAEALAVSLLSATLVLFVLREISLDAGALEAVGKVVYEAVPFAVGVSLARHYLQGSREGGDDEERGRRRGGRRGRTRRPGAPDRRRPRRGGDRRALPRVQHRPDRRGADARPRRSRDCGSLR